MKEFFISRTLEGDINVTLDRGRVWQADKSKICRAIQDISESYYQRNFTLTLRQLYYQLVGKDLIPNHDKVYKKIGGLKDDLLYSGQLNWSAFEDRGRVPSSVYTYKGVKDALMDTARTYRIDRQRGQEVVVEVWTEKDAISQILKRVTHKYGLKLMVNKGYSSSTAMYNSYQRFVDPINEKKPVVILYFGDHDPSGLDMIRDIYERIIFFLSRGDELSWYVVNEWWNYEGLTVHDMADFFDELANGTRSKEDEKKARRMERMMKKLRSQKWGDQEDEDFDIFKKEMFIRYQDLLTVKHVGLTMEQIQEYNPPPNPAKVTDPRAKDYVRIHGRVSWEVDALTPEQMISIVEEGVTSTIDMDTYQSMLNLEAIERKAIEMMAESYAGNGSSEEE